MLGWHLLSSQAVSQNFTKEHFVVQVYKLSYFFGPAVTAEILFKQHSFHKPKTMLDPTI
jgi:hypothetical protein